MQSNGGLIDLRGGRRARRLDGALGPGRRRRRGGVRRPAPAASPTRCASTWAAPRATSAWSTTAPCRSRAPATIAGRPLALPMVAVHTVGAGGGSIALARPRRRAAGRARARPGADPGPACYGRGGTEPTVTDANLCSATWPPTRRWPAAYAWIRTPRERAVGRAGRRARARAAGLRRGDRPGRQRRDGARAAGRDRASAGSIRAAYALLAFGGAGPLHAAAIADELGITTIVCPRASGVLAALGLVVSAAPARRPAQRAA